MTHAVIAVKNAVDKSVLLDFKIAYRSAIFFARKPMDRITASDITFGHFVFAEWTSHCLFPLLYQAVISLSSPFSAVTLTSAG